MASDIPEFRNDPAWLRLSYARREKAAARLNALTTYEAIETPTLKDAETAARAGATSLRQFYALLKAWRAPEGRTIWTLVPYAKRKLPAMPKLAHEVETLLHAEIRHAIAGGKRTPRDILGEVARRWPKEGPKLPGDNTIRAHVESAGGLDVIATGPFTLNASRNPQEEAETATRHGEVLVIDHTAPDIFIDRRPPQRATLTLAIDLHSATIAGFAVSTGAPTADAVLAVVDDAARRAEENPGEAIKPRLVLAATSGDSWRALLRRLERRGLQATVRWSTRLHRGGPTKRLIGSRIADVELQSRMTHDRSGAAGRFDPARHALLTIEQAELVIADAVSRLNADRLVEGAFLNRIIAGR